MKLTDMDIEEALKVLRTWRDMYEQIRAEAKNSRQLLKLLRKESMHSGLCLYVYRYGRQINPDTYLKLEELIDQFAEQLYLRRIVSRFGYRYLDTGAGYICATPYFISCAGVADKARKSKFQAMRESLWVRRVCVDALIKALENALS